MAAVHHPGCPHRDSLYWDETDCLNYYGMLSLHEVFEIVGCQLTETDIEVLSFLLNETCSTPHPLDPIGWTVEPRAGDPDDPGVSPSPELIKAWRRLKPKSSQAPLVASCKPTSGLQLLLELEKRGYISDGNLEPLLQLLRVLTRHDLLPFVSRKKRRTVSPERILHSNGQEKNESVKASEMQHAYRQTEIPFPPFSQQMRNGVYPSMPGTSVRKRRKKRGNGWSRKSKKTSRQSQPLPLPQPPYTVSCRGLSERGGSLLQQKSSAAGFHLKPWDNDMGDDLSRVLAEYNIRLRVRAEYLEHETVLRGSVSSDKQQPLERQFELFGQANSLLRARDLGSIVCDIRFTELDNLEAFWSDYLKGDLLEALKGVFITDSLRVAAGHEGIRLLISVDQDDYEHGRSILRASSGGGMLSSGHGGHRETHWAV